MCIFCGRPSLVHDTGLATPVFDAAASDGRDDTSASDSFAAAIPPAGAAAEVAFISGVTSTGTVLGPATGPGTSTPLRLQHDSFCQQVGQQHARDPRRNVLLFDAASGGPQPTDQARLGFVSPVAKHVLARLERGDRHLHLSAAMTARPTRPAG